MLVINIPKQGHGYFFAWKFWNNEKFCIFSFLVFAENARRPCCRMPNRGPCISCCILDHLSVQWLSQQSNYCDGSRQIDL
jgi:hypothetical protein